jgi:hypothetical protein
MVMEIVPTFFFSSNFSFFPNSSIFTSDGWHELVTPDHGGRGGVRGGEPDDAGVGA